MATHSIRCCVLMFASLLAAAVSRPVLASDSPGLNWVRLDGAEACLSSAELAAAVNVRVGGHVFEAPERAGLLVEGHVARVGDGWTVRLDLVDAAGKRVGQRQLGFRGESCHVIDESVTLVIAVMLYPNTRLLAPGEGLQPDTRRNFDRLFAAEPSELDATTLPSAVAVPVAPPPDPADAAPKTAGASASVRPRGFPVALTLGGLFGTGPLPGLNVATS